MGDNAYHILFDCTALCEDRNAVLLSLNQSMPAAMLQCYSRLSKYEKMKFLLSGMPNEFAQVMKCIANYVFVLYQKRKELYDAE